MSGNLARQRQTKFMPADFKLIEARKPPLKDQYDEWLARIIFYAFSAPASERRAERCCVFRCSSSNERKPSVSGL
jgi:hypothetical protein